MPVYRLPDNGVAFPNPEYADSDGLLAVGGDLEPQRLIAAYSIGVFPWYNKDSPPLWWSPDPRCILLPEEFHLPGSLARVLKKRVFSFTIDKAFSAVIHACAAPRRNGDGTWLTPEMIEAYITLHTLGVAHSVEAWRNGTLAGGLYGLALGTAFFGESMFYRVSNASKAAFAHLVRHLQKNGCTLIDCQQVTANLLRFGAKAVSRKEFGLRLSSALRAYG
ncbi:MAG: leucyl/phenylalanyl-tRNA--protein transferase [Desulfovibrio sp.]|jgi:leucyl/phenylalanyl-tRNA--protein transferase|nr:leucyl/phenylalanyl-tRNA--protein transferase [Desulfovibrio sp.]